MIPNFIISSLGPVLSKLSTKTSCNVFSLICCKNYFVPTHQTFSNITHIKRCCHTNSTSYLEFSDFIKDDEKLLINENMIVKESFLSEDEEKSLLGELEPYMKRLHYEFSHWDNAIHGYRETERLQWNEANTKIIRRVKDSVFPPGTPQIRHVHILDLAEEGYIKPHIDSERFCGDTIAGMSLLTDSVMRLVHDKEKDKSVDVLLKRRSLYVMKGTVRYDYTHEILPNDKSTFRSQLVKKSRRISIICRNEPSSS